jgi:hypothetical protein
MNTSSHSPASRAPKIKGSVRVLFFLSPAEDTEANYFATLEDRSRSSFARAMYLRGLKSFKAEQGIPQE